jgi:hypothetical protein
VSALISYIKGKPGLRVFENRIPRRLFEPGREEVTGGWRKPHKVEFNNLWSSSGTVKMIKPRRMTRVEHKARMGEVRNLQNH